VQDDNEGWDGLQAELDKGLWSIPFDGTARDTMFITETREPRRFAWVIYLSDWRRELCKSREGIHPREVIVDECNRERLYWDRG
jgi:hypothetical protein